MTLALFPDSAECHDGELVIGGVAATTLARRFGTPLYVYDAETIRNRARAYLEPVRPIGGRVVVALKANPVPGVLRVAQRAGLGADAASAGEIAVALAAGFDPAGIIAHGNAKSDEDLHAALSAGVGLVVLDAIEEADALAALARAAGRTQDVLVRVTPDIAVDTHDKIRTGHAGSKFGLDPHAAAALARSLPAGLRFAGLHVHLGSQVTDAAPLRDAASWSAAFIADAGIDVKVLDLGGGLGVSYSPGVATPDPGRYVAGVGAAVQAAFATIGRDPPRLVLEPGRSVLAQSGVTLYRVVVVKPTTTGVTWVAVDGGMADNPRVALYDAPYHPRVATRLQQPPSGVYAVAGRHCESGDVLAWNVALPAPTVGDLIAVPVTGAYHQSMASTYNCFPRPAAVLVDDASARLVTRRETVDDLVRALDADRR